MNKKEAFVKNAADPKQVKNGKRKEEDLRFNQLNDIKVVMSTKEGRRFMYRLINEICHYDSNDFNNSGSITYHNLGERNVGRQVKSDVIESCFKEFQKMEEENWPFLIEQKGDQNARQAN